MDGLKLNSGDVNRAGGIGPEARPDDGSTIISIKVSHGPNQHEVAVPSNSTFGDLKSAIAQKIGLSNPDSHKLFFRGKEKEDDDDLQTAGVKDNAKMLLVEHAPNKRKSPEKVVEETTVVSRGGEAVAKVREEVDKLSQQVEALQTVVDSGTKVDEKDIIYLTEMLMRELLKLDMIEAEGEGKVQRKMEVRRIQSYVETMDIIKSRNSNISTNVNNTNNNNLVSVTTQWETFDDGIENTNAASTPVLQSDSSSQSSSNLSPALDSSCTSSVQKSVPNQSSAQTDVTSQQSHTHDMHIPPPSSTPCVESLSAPSALASSTKVTQEWEHFD